MVDRSSKLMNRVNAAATAMRKRLDVTAVYLFGSQVRKTNDQWSDIDIGVFLAGFDTASFSERIRAIVEVQRELGDDLEFHFFDASDPANQESVSFAAEIIKTGVRVA